MGERPIDTIDIANWQAPDQAAEQQVGREAEAVASVEADESRVAVSGMSGMVSLEQQQQHSRANFGHYVPSAAEAFGAVYDGARQNKLATNDLFRAAGKTPPYDIV